MAYDPAFGDWVRDHLHGLGPIEIKRMFGGAGVKSGGSMFAILDDGVLWLKADEALARDLEAEGARRFTYPTKDGWIFLMCQTQRFWQMLCEKIGRPELVSDPAYRDREARHANRERLTEELDATLDTRTTAEWLEIMGGAVPCAPVYDLRQALESPFALEREAIQRLEHPDHGVGDRLSGLGIHDTPGERAGLGQGRRRGEGEKRDGRGESAGAREHDGLLSE